MAYAAHISTSHMMHRINVIIHLHSKAKIQVAACTHTMKSLAYIKHIMKKIKNNTK